MDSSSKTISIQNESFGDDAARKFQFLNRALKEQVMLIEYKTKLQVL